MNILKSNIFYTILKSHLRIQSKKKVIYFSLEEINELLLIMYNELLSITFILPRLMLIFRLFL